MNSHLNEDVAGGILLVDKPKGKTSFALVGTLRKIFGIKKIGHAGTLDPFATGVMVMLIGRKYTRLSNQFLCEDKEYTATLHLGITTDTYDCEGKIINENSSIPSVTQVKEVLSAFQGDLDQIPPMFSAKKVKGRKLYELARQGKEIERQAVKVRIEIDFLDYAYPYLKIYVKCSKGTYIRSLAYDIGKILGCGAHLSALRRVKSGPFSIESCIGGDLLSPTEATRNLLQDRLLHQI